MNVTIAVQRQCKTSPPTMKTCVKAYCIQFYGRKVFNLMLDTLYFQAFELFFIIPSFRVQVSRGVLLGPQPVLSLCPMELMPSAMCMFSRRKTAPEWWHMQEGGAPFSPMVPFMGTWVWGWTDLWERRISPPKGRKSRWWETEDRCVSLWVACPRLAGVHSLYWEK